jgi:outer membrane protein assembly factor BamA
VFLDSINFHDNPNGDQLVVATLNLTKNTRYIIDSVVVKGDAKIKEGYLYNYLGIKPGDGYNEELTTNIGLRIKEIPFLKETKPAHVIFTDSKANLNLNLSGKQASKFDAMVGFLPSGDSEGKLIITGEARLKLLNSFGVGELIGLNWRSLSPGTQDLETVIAYPFLISRFGIDAGFSLYKKDTIYLDISSNLGIRYLLNRGDYLRVFIKSKETRLLSDQAPLASYANSRSVLYGIGYNKKKLDYLLNPSKGYNLVLAGSAGNKKINLNSDSNTDSTETKTAEYNINALVDFYFPLGARVVCKIGLNGAFVESESLFENELFRIGGMRTLRGFDEESVTASLYGIYNLELRYLMEQNTFFYVFFNGAYYENEVKRVQNSIWSDHPYGYGAGLTFENKAGIFSINYALGQQMGNPPDFRAAKVHFGIANRF